ncbi:MAG: right-handed parallel beta-helix repeat-containing protein [Planctomycetota bacterium]
MASGRAVSYRVPGDFAAIQDVDAAQKWAMSSRSRPGPGLSREASSAQRQRGGGAIILQAEGGARPILDGTGVAGATMVLIANRSYVTLRGFEIRGNTGVNDGSGIRVIGSGSHIELRDNLIHDLRGTSAMGITVYGTSTTAAITNLVIDGNEMHDCDAAPSEAITLNGNVDGFVVAHNYVHDVNNIGIDMIGGEADINPQYVTRNGQCVANTILRARSTYGGGYAAGLYVDGARDLLVQGNFISQCDLGLEVGAEHAQVDATGITVRDNVIHGNDKAGLVFGGYDASVGRVRQCVFMNNVCHHNDRLHVGLGELWIQHAQDNVLRNNLFVADDQGVLMYSEDGNAQNQLDYNAWHTTATLPAFVWRGQLYPSFASYRAGTAQDAHSQFADPLLVSPAQGDFHLADTSPCIDAGNPADVFIGSDAAQHPRVLDGKLSGTLRIDIGAYEHANIALAASGTAARGSLLTIDLTGAPALPSLLLLGTAPLATLLPPYGTLAIDLAAPRFFLVTGALPRSLALAIPQGLPSGFAIVLQGLIVNASGGNLSNAVLAVVP